ncbi:cAMP-binding domain of CRP or a regulatory subunit of cAMP-dependent protein kinases [Sporobacter termitidis DSM 10068]|uniref:cAMP-binding domain of CRP or a regulatory subunit of cAMP-dependent protein kinases n=1 Tax=Sporobacter termitidis DSM 10068 TaxID=1123282 RepID=A0A1M5XCT4_9FIRM|nr:Crp/Fnr family transcriptional regulator [Sporobacter termitidis]SHH97586.1 cAMP-binding domain of CRP or a regulatory subunit of cAMP-dependent protein kinases [Sporobacter termitidis DSM 10068]
MKTEKKYLEYMELIKSQPLFRGFDEEDIRYLLDYLTAVVEIVDAGEPINTIGTSAVEPVQSGCILSGRGQHIKYDAWGKCSILEYITPGYLLGCTHTFADNHYHMSTIMATEPCVCLYLDFKKLDSGSADCVSALSRLSVNIIRILAKRNYRLFRKVDILSRRTLREKILTYLSYERDEHQSDVFDVPFSRQGMADFLYIERSSLSTELSKLQQEGLIEFHHNHFKLTMPK